MVRWMRMRWGLRAKMAGSYVLVTAVAVAVVEAIVLMLVVPAFSATSMTRVPCWSCSPRSAPR